MVERDGLRQVVQACPFPDGGEGWAPSGCTLPVTHPVMDDK